MKILFLDQTGNVGGAELVLLDNAYFYRQHCRVALFADGPFRHLLESKDIAVTILGRSEIISSKDDNLLKGLVASTQLLPLIYQVLVLSADYDVIYANTLKALIVGAVASAIGRKPLVFHLHDLLSNEFSRINRAVIVQLANRFATKVITVSKAAEAAFIQAGGCPDIVQTIYNGFDATNFQISAATTTHLKQKLNLEHKFVVGCFGRLDRGKGQNILIEALKDCPSNVVAVFVGSQCFGTDDYVKSLHDRVAQLNLTDRVHFLGFCPNIAELMSVCDVITQTSLMAESFGRVIVEAMLARRVMIASRSSASVEIIQANQTGILVSPGDSTELTQAINRCYEFPTEAAQIAQAGYQSVYQRFHLSAFNDHIDCLLNQVLIGQKYAAISDV
jgi:glycosyltransferase involved in cell wall biosynthesis